MDTLHEQAVAELAAQVRRFYKKNQPFRVYHGSTNSTRVQAFDRDKMVDVSQLNRVLSIDPKKKTAVVEPNVPMDRLVEATLEHNLIPPVVMEFPGITVGGGLQGGAGESSSYKYGTFNRTLNWYDLVLANGEVVRASRQQHADLFWGAAGSYGSLGVVTAAEIQLVPASPYVELTYTPINSFQQAVDTMTKLSKQKPNFIDGVLYDKTCGVIMTGTLTDKTQAPVRTFTKPKDEWFYLHAEKLARKGKAHTEAIPITDYFFRYDRGAFWMGRYSFQLFHMPFNRFMRWLLDPLMHTRKMYDALQASGVSQQLIIQDLALPSEQTVPFLQFVDQQFGIYPLWLCPLLPDADSPLLSNYQSTKSIINVGVWGHLEKSPETMVAKNRLLEDKLYKLKGKKWFYAHAFYTEKQFWNIYNKRWYTALRKKYHATTLPTIYDKTCTSKPSEVHAKRGVLYALLGKSGIKVRD